MGNKLDKVMNLEVGQSFEVTKDALVEELPPLKAGDEGYVDPLELEKQLLEEERRRMQADPDPIEIATMMLTLYTPRFCAQIDRLSNRQLRRVIKSLVEFPVGKTYRHTDATERECFGIGKNLMDAKYVLVAHTYNENREKIMAAAEKAADEMTTEFNSPEADLMKTVIVNEEKEVTNG